MYKAVTPAQAVSRIRRGEHVFIGSGAAEPQSLVNALVARGTHFATALSRFRIQNTGLPRLRLALGARVRCNVKADTRSVH